MNAVHPDRGTAAQDRQIVDAYSALVAAGGRPWSVRRAQFRGWDCWPGSPEKRNTQSQGLTGVYRTQTLRVALLILFYRPPPRLQRPPHDGSWKLQKKAHPMQRRHRKSDRGSKGNYALPPVARPAMGRQSAAWAEMRCIGT